MFEKKVLDISHWQGDVDFRKLKENNVWGVILKCGGAENGKYYVDKKFFTNYAQAVQNGLHVGCYWFTGMKFSAINESNYFHKIISDMKFDLPVYIDFEVSTPQLKRENTQYVIDFIENMYRLGKYFVGIYASDVSGFMDRLNAPLLLNYTWWVARYGSEVKYAKMNCHMWQYTSSGVVSGIKGYVDMNFCYRDFPTVIIGGHYNGY